MLLRRLLYALSGLTKQEASIKIAIGTGTINQHQPSRRQHDTSNDRPPSAPMADHATDLSLFHYGQDKAILYALAVGEHQQLRYLYETHEQFSIVPSFAILPGLKALIESEVFTSTMADRKLVYDPTRLLHGEQFIELHKPIPAEAPHYGPLVTSRRARVLEVLDKGTSTVIVTETDTHDHTGQLLFTNQMASFMTGTGGWGGPRQNSDPRTRDIVKPPADGRPPDRVVCQATSPHQAMLYRLLGDRNPLHIDGQFAALAGFDRPILHGLCTLGFATRHIIESYSSEEPQNCLRIKARFSGVIFPGETIQTEMWKEANRIHFQCKVKDTGKPLISGGYMDLADTQAPSGTFCKVSAL